MNINIDVNSANNLERKESSESICEIYIINKQNKTSSWKSHIRIIKVDELIYTNLINDDKIFKINEKSRCVTTMINNYSQYMIIYLLKRKFNLKDVLWKYLKFMKIQSTLIHWLHSNNKDEYADH